MFDISHLDLNTITLGIRTSAAKDDDSLMLSRIDLPEFTNLAALCLAPQASLGSLQVRILWKSRLTNRRTLSSSQSPTVFISTNAKRVFDTRGPKDQNHVQGTPTSGEGNERQYFCASSSFRFDEATTKKPKKIHWRERYGVPRKKQKVIPRLIGHHRTIRRMWKN
jgi:hypothetical protein